MPAICGRPALAIERSLGSFLLEPGHLLIALSGGPQHLHQEMVTLRQTLKTALRHGWPDRLPDFSEPFRSSPKISHRAWFSSEEYKALRTNWRSGKHYLIQKGWVAWRPSGVSLNSSIGLEDRTMWRLEVRRSAPCHCLGAVALELES